MKISFNTNYICNPKSHVNFGKKWQITRDRINESYPNDENLKRYMDDIYRYDLLSHKQKDKLMEKVIQGGEDADRAREKLIQSNLRLVVFLANGMRSKKLPMLDLIQEGNMALMHAIDVAKAKKDVTFTPYISTAVRYRLINANKNMGDVVRIPDSVKSDMKKLQKAKDQYYEKHGEYPSKEALLQASGMTERQLNTCYFIREIESLDDSVNHISGDFYKKGLNIPTPTFSKKYSGATLSDYVEIAQERTPADEAVEKDLSRGINRVLKTLTERERQVVKDRFGLENGYGMSLEEVARKYKVTRERIRQVEAKALRKLRHPSRCNVLRGYTGDC